MKEESMSLTPTIWEVLFSIKTFAAATLALFIAFCFELPNSYWALTTVYIVAHLLSGASTSKAVYRLMGTVVGGAMTVVLVPNLVNSPELLALGISMWMGICLAFSLLDRTPRSYAFMLAGYTTALTSFPIVSSPETAFTYRLLRAGWADIAAVARRSKRSNTNGLLHRMVDRLGLIAPRLASLPADSYVVQNYVLKDLRNGLNTVELQRHKLLLTRTSGMAIDDVLASVSIFYQEKRHKTETVPQDGLLQALDRSLAALKDGGSSSAVEGARRALTGLRYSLFPQARGFAANENRPAGENDVKEHAA